MSRLALRCTDLWAQLLGQGHFSLSLESASFAVWLLLSRVLLPASILTAAAQHSNYSCAPGHHRCQASAGSLRRRPAAAQHTAEAPP